eukprot:CAMPEP_0170500932 /NCGR_PEP_ID=MMETSP0208-20121228/36584_1 /TAXON_ID=197538 /ORGANISM="Strombidium inclinatum, Strain S3" /LENGTH=148 /DNA_ID=CAMNT_0010779213 /DNA_START=488 /DNA_END=933 /DNA_ORIENTATION=-
MYYLWKPSASPATKNPSLILMIEFWTAPPEIVGSYSPNWFLEKQRNSTMRPIPFSESFTSSPQEELVRVRIQQLGLPVEGLQLAQAVEVFQATLLTAVHDLVNKNPDVEELGLASLPLNVRQAEELVDVSIRREFASWDSSENFESLH